ncbi:MAG: hypothetical protein ACK55Z_20465, partial [bacterium]
MPYRSECAGLCHIAGSCVNEFYIRHVIVARNSKSLCFCKLLTGNRKIFINYKASRERQGLLDLNVQDLDTLR